MSTINRLMRLSGPTDRRVGVVHDSDLAVGVVEASLGKLRRVPACKSLDVADVEIATTAVHLITCDQRLAGGSGDRLSICFPPSTRWHSTG